jgi:hypothetical protein
VAFGAVQALLSPSSVPEAQSHVSPGVTGTRTRPGDLRPYAFSLNKLRGLSPGTRSGTGVELWAIRSGDDGRKPDSELMISEAIVKRIVPPLTPVGPETAVLLVPEEVIPKLMRAELLGASITAVVIADP